MLTKAELQTKRQLETRWTELVYDGLWFSPAARRDRRVRRHDAGARHRRGAAALQAGRRGRQRPALGERALLGDARLVRRRRDVPARGGRGLHPDRVARDRAARAARARQARRGVTLWSGPTGDRRLAPEVWEFLRADDAELLPYDCEATRDPRASTRRRRLLLRPSELAEAEASARRIAAGSSTRSPKRRGRPLGDRARARRRSAARSTPGGRGTTRWRPRSGSTSATRAREAVGAIEALAATRARPGRERGRHARCPATRTCSAPSPSRSATTCSPGSRCSTATVDASASPPAQACPSAARRGRAGRLDARPAAPAGRDRANSLDAVADRDFALDYLYACGAALRPPLADRRGARASGRRPSSASSGCPRRRRPARR